MVGLGVVDAIAESFEAEWKTEPRPSQGLTVTELGKTAVLREIAVTPLRVEEIHDSRFKHSPHIGREVCLRFRIENRSDGQAIALFPASVFLHGRTRDEFGNEMISLGFGVGTVDEMGRTDTLKPGDSIEKAVYATFPPVDEAQRFTWDQRFVVSQDGTVETLSVTFDRASIQPADEAQ